MSQALQNIDWDLLHQQKRSLLTLQQRTPKDSCEWQALEGIVCLLDAIQDEAVEEGTWQFPDMDDARAAATAPRKTEWPQSAAQRIYEAYPDRDLLPIEPPAPSKSISRFALRAEQAADTLFLFLCREADDQIDLAEYVQRLNRAIRDIEAVRDGLMTA